MCELIMFTGGYYFPCIVFEPQTLIFFDKTISLVSEKIIFISKKNHFQPIG